MPSRLLALAAFAALLFAGCVTPDEDVLPDAPIPTVTELLAGPALYLDPQNAPHPAYNWPTLSNPPIGDNVPQWWRPINGSTLPAVIAGMEHMTATPGVGSGAGLALFGSLAVVPGYGNPSFVVDISEPTAPKVLSQFESQLGSHRGATFIAYPDGRLVTVISTGSGLDVWDLTDPTAPQPLTPIEIASHKVGVVPGTPIVYNAGSCGGSATCTAGPDAQTGEGVNVIEMFDLSDPVNPVRLPDFENGYSCHHIYFWNSAEQNKSRAICAGIEYTQIIDTADPKNPEVIVSVPYGHGMPAAPSGSAFIAAFSHYAGLSVDGTILLVGDEHGGGIGPIGCAARVDTPAGAVSSPIGAVWFYDVSDELNPMYKGHVSASQLERAGGALDASCTAHHGRLLPVPGQDVLAMSFYGAGVLLVDFTAVRGETPGLPTVLDQFTDGSNTWETWYYDGYLFTGDMARGMDVLKIV